METSPRCWVGVKVFGNELGVFTCEDLNNHINQMSLSLAGLAVKLLKVRPRCNVDCCHSVLFELAASLLVPAGSGGGAAPQGRADHRGAGFTLSVWFACQTGHQHDLPHFTAPEGQRQLQRLVSLLPDWTPQTHVLPYEPIFYRP